MLPGQSALTVGVPVIAPYLHRQLEELIALAPNNSHHVCTSPGPVQGQVLLWIPKKKPCTLGTAVVPRAGQLWSPPRPTFVAMLLIEWYFSHENESSQAKQAQPAPSIAAGATSPWDRHTWADHNHPLGQTGALGKKTAETTFFWQHNSCILNKTFLI